MADLSDDGSPAKRIAALDLGTNSFHVVIVDIYPDGSFRIIDKLKEMVILAEKGLKHRLSDEAMERGISALKKIKILCDSQGVEQIIAYATSAIREAENGGEFIQRMIDEVQIKAHAISGKKEAELIGHAIQYAVSIGDKPVLMVDIGGGSVEFILADRQQFFYSSSKKVGVARMAAAFVDHDPITKEEIRKLRAHFENELKDLFEALKDHDIDTIIGSSGTMENIAEMIANEQSISSSLTLNELTYSVKDYKKFHKKFIKLNREERLKQKGLEEKRVDIIAPGLVLLDFLIEKAALNLSEIIFFHFIRRLALRNSSNLSPSFLQICYIILNTSDILFNILKLALKVVPVPLTFRIPFVFFAPFLPFIFLYVLKYICHLLNHLRNSSTLIWAK
jgi:exopolyphosphatase/guanosine-5'-triphosphate,3'-diphosphate pyrophosphatase